MALVTTFMTGPLLRLIDPRREMAAAEPETLDRPPADARAAGSRWTGCGPRPRHPRGRARRPELGRPPRDRQRARPRDAPARGRRRPPPGAERGRNRDLGAGSPLPRGSRGARGRTRHVERRSAAADRRTLLAASVAGSIRLAGPDRVDLALVDGWRPVLGGGVLGGPIRPLLEEAPSDVAVLVRREELGVVSRPVPARHRPVRWSGARLGRVGTGRPGSRPRPRSRCDYWVRQGPSGRPEDDPTRLLANASVVLQQLTGVSAETRLVDVAGGGLLPAVEDASLLVVGLSLRWRG